MKAFKLTVLVLLVTIIIALITALFLPREVVISQEIFIKAKPQVVFRQVNSLRNYIKWSPYEEDSTMTNVFEGPESGVGAKRIWNGEKSGFGSITITESSPYKLIKNFIEFGPQGKAIESWNFDLSDDVTQVTWTTRVYDLNYPVGRLFGIFMDDIMIPKEIKGLENLKILSESLPKAPEIIVIETETVPSVVLFDSTAMEEIEALLKKNYEILTQFIMQNKLKITGHPFAVYYDLDTIGMIKIRAGIPIDRKFENKNLFSYFELPAGKAIFVEQTGGYNTSESLIAIHDFALDFNLKQTHFFWESYLFDPEIEKDTSKWVTHIYYPFTE